MSAIAGIAEDFEGASAGTAISTANTVFDNVAAGDGAATFYATNPFTGTRSMRTTTTAGNSTFRSNCAASPTVWYAFAVRFAVFPGATSSIVQFYSDTTVSGTLRLNSSGSLTFRDAATNRWTSNALALNTWYEIHIRVTPGSNAEVKIYNANGSLFQESGTLQLLTAGSVDNIRIGSLAGAVASDTQWDAIRADNATEPATINIDTPPIDPPDPDTWSFTTPVGWAPIDLAQRTS